MATATKNQKLPLQQDPNKFYYHFVYKATLVLIFFVILPLFPSQAPEFINQSLLTRNWELLHLIFVGVAISYGLFSRRNDETEKDHNSKFDTAQSLVSRFLQVSSFFEDEAENPVESDETKVQTWSNQHHRNEPVLVVAPQVKKSYSFNDRNGEKPLLLPVRSLKSRLSEDVEDIVHVQSLNKSTSFKRFSSNSNRKAEVETNDDDDDVVVVHSQNRSTTSSKRFSNRNAQVEADDDDVDFDVQSLNKSTSSKRFSNNSVRNAQVEVARVENNKKDNVVLPSPIPWRSRSGRMEPKQEEINDASNTILLPSKEEYRPVKSQTSRASQNLTSVPSSESLAKNAEDFVKKKGFYKSCPPPPPPPPPMMFYKSVSMKPRYASFTEEPSSGKELKRSFTSERKKTDEEQEQEQSMQRTSFRSVAPVSQPGEEESFLDKVIVESDDDTESDDEDVENESDKGPPESSKTDETCCGSVSDEGPDVDKKADEFIAKFREQIRLQRIESIKRSTRTARNSSR